MISAPISSANGGANSSWCAKVNQHRRQQIDCPLRIYGKLTIVRHARDFDIRLPCLSKREIKVRGKLTYKLKYKGGQHHGSICCGSRETELSERTIICKEVNSVDSNDDDHFWTPDSISIGRGTSRQAF